MLIIIMWWACFNRSPLMIKSLAPCNPLSSALRGFFFSGSSLAHNTYSTHFYLLLAVVLTVEQSTIYKYRDRGPIGWDWKASRFVCLTLVDKLRLCRCGTTNRTEQLRTSRPPLAAGRQKWGTVIYILATVRNKGWKGCLLELRLLVIERICTRVISRWRH